MKLINTNGVLTFTPEGNETADQQAFLARMSQYRMRANGATIRVYDEEGTLITFIKPFDNTQHILADDGYQLAADFGAKRFLAGEARRLMNDEKRNQFNVIHFPRDLAFPVERPEHETKITYHVHDLEDLLKQFRADKTKLYTALSELFNRCADFTPGKQNEYLEGGKIQDKYCRFNLVNNHDRSVTSTEQVFLTDMNDNIVGTISATVMEEGADDAYALNNVTIYFYDEVVDYFTLLSTKERQLLDSKLQQLSTTTDDAGKATLTKEIADLIEPKRTKLMAQLFAAIREHLRDNLPHFEERVERGLVHAFIRAAAGRVDMYKALGCEESADNYVIHGQPTAQLKLLDAYVKGWAAEQLQALQPRPSTVTVLAAPRPGAAVDAPAPAAATNSNTM